MVESFDRFLDLHCLSTHDNLRLFSLINNLSGEINIIIIKSNPKFIDVSSFSSGGKPELAILLILVIITNVRLSND